MKRLLCILLCLSLLSGVLCFAMAEEDEPEFSEEEMEEMEEEQREAAEDTEAVVEGEVYHEKTREDFDLNSPAIYTGVIRTDFGKVIWAEKNAQRFRGKHLGREGHLQPQEQAAGMQRQEAGYPVCRPALDDCPARQRDRICKKGICRQERY